MILRYYLWGIGQKTLSYTPGGKRLYAALGAAVNRGRKGRQGTFKSSLRLVRKAKDLVPAQGRVVDVGTGWFHNTAFLLHVVGDYEIHLFDVNDNARLEYIYNYVRALLENTPLLGEALDVEEEQVRARLEPLLRLRSREDIYRACNFHPLITRDTSRTFLPEASVDFMLSNCVLNHIPPRILLPELIALRRMLKPSGSMYHLLGHDDHWSFHDSSANRFNYYRYPDWYYSLFFDTKFEYQNRFVKQEWLEIFDRCRLDVEEYFPYITDESRDDIRRLPRIADRFAPYPLEELAIIHSYVLLRRADVPPAGECG